MERGASRWDNSSGGKRPEEMDDEERFRVKRAAAGALLADLDRTLEEAERSLDRGRTRLQ